MGSRLRLPKALSPACVRIQGGTAPPSPRDPPAPPNGPLSIPLRLPLSALLQGGDAAPPSPPATHAFGKASGSRSLPPPRRAPSPARGRLRQRGGGGAERRGGLLAGVQPGLAPSFASGQEAEPRVERPSAGSRAASLPPSPRGPSPALGPGLRLRYPISRAARGPPRPHISEPPAPVFAPSGLQTPGTLPSPASPVASKLPRSRRAGGTPLAPHRQAWAVSVMPG